MHLQVNTLFDLWHWPWGQGHRKCCPVPSSSFNLYTCNVWPCYVEKFRWRCIHKKIHYLTLNLDLCVKITRNVTQYPLHYVTYAPTQFEVATSKCLGGNSFTGKYIIRPLALTSLPSTSLDLFNYKVWSFWTITVFAFDLKQWNA